MTQKEISEEWLKARGIRICSWLPEAEVVLRPAQEVADRSMALVAVSEAAFGARARLEGMDEEDFFVPEDAIGWLADVGLLESLTPAEKLFLNGSQSDMQEVTNFCWRGEAAWVLAWALGWEKELGPWVSDPHLSLARRMMMARDSSSLPQNPSLRS